MCLLFGDEASGLDDVPGGLDVALLSNGHQSGPGHGDETAGARASECRRHVNTARPVNTREELKLSELRTAVHDHRGALRREAVLVRVAADRGHARQAEVERRQRKAGSLHPDDEEAAQACVHVQRHVVFDRNAGQLLDGIDRAHGKVRCRADNLFWKFNKNVN